MIERVSLFRFVPLPGTFVYDNAEKYNLRNTDKDENWNGDWSRYHIHHNHLHWWGTEEEFGIMNKAYHKLEKYVHSTWGI